MLSVYYVKDHSCTDVTIVGTLPLNQFSYDQQPSSWPYKSLPLQNYTQEQSSFWNDGWLQLADQPAHYKPFITNYNTLPCLRQPNQRPTLGDTNPNANRSKMIFILAIIVLVLIIIFLVAYLIKRKFYDFHYHSLLTRQPVTSRDDEVQLQKILDRQTTSKLAPSYYEEDDYDSDQDVPFSSTEKGTLNRLEMYRKNLVEGSLTPPKNNIKTPFTNLSDDMRL